MKTIKREVEEFLEVGDIYVPPDILLRDCKSKFSQKYWSNYLFKDKYLKLRCNFYMGIQGVEGDLALMSPAVPYDVDNAEWGVTKAGTEDCWEFIGFSFYQNEHENAYLRIFFHDSTYFEEGWNTLVKEIKLYDYEDFMVLKSSNFELSPKKIWDFLFKLFKEELGAVESINEEVS